jgi:hypothetical protein
MSTPAELAEAAKRWTGPYQSVLIKNDDGFALANAYARELDTTLAGDDY